MTDRPLRWQQVILIGLGALILGGLLMTARQLFTESEWNERATTGAVLVFFAAVAVGFTVYVDALGARR